MMSLEAIRSVKRKQARKAEKARGVKGKQPWVAMEGAGLDAIRGIPHFGDYRPKGWEELGSRMVDASGFGAPDEPAMTPDQFLKSLVPGHGYAITEAGQFQVYITEFKLRR